MDCLDDVKINRKLEFRRASRNHVVNIIFQLEFLKNQDINSILNTYFDTLKYELEFELKQDPNFKVFIINQDLITNYVLAIFKNLETIDSKINEFSIDWDLIRIDKVDLAILRVAIYEIIYEKDIPKEVAINEAVEIAKEYSSKDSYKFINGILSKI